MPKRLFRKYLPSPERIRANRSLSFLGHVLGDPNLWHINRHSLSGAAFIGIFCAFLPIPAQMIPAALLAIRFKSNLPLSLVLVWLTNPLTYIPVFYVTYRVGAWILGMPVHPPERMSVAWMLEQLLPLWMGSLVSGLVLGLLAWGMVKLVWRLAVARKWQRRRTERAQANSSRPS